MRQGLVETAAREQGDGEPAVAGSETGVEIDDAAEAALGGRPVVVLEPFDFGQSQVGIGVARV